MELRWAQVRQALARGELPEKVAQRVARYHLVDNTRGEPPMWKPGEIRELDLELKRGRLKGKIVLRTEDSKRGYEAALHGIIETTRGKVTRFDLVALGKFHGEGRYTRGAPPGRFPLAVSFELADGSDVADRVPPQGSRGWVAGYLR